MCNYFDGTVSYLLGGLRGATFFGKCIRRYEPTNA